VEKEIRWEIYPERFQERLGPLKENWEAQRNKRFPTGPLELGKTG